MRLTPYQGPDGAPPTHIESIDGEEESSVLRVGLRLVSGEQIRLEFYDFSDLEELGVGEREDSTDLGAIRELAYARYLGEPGIFSWLLCTERSVRVWKSECPVAAGSADVGEATNRRLERDRRYGWRRRLNWLLNWRTRRVVRHRVGQLVDSLRLSVPPDLAVLNRANQLLNDGIAAQAARKFNRAERCYQESLSLYAQHRDALTWAKGHHQMGNVNIERGNFDSGRHWHLRSLELARKHGFKQLEASSLYWLGSIELQQPKGDQGLKWFEESAAIARTIGAVQDLANAEYGIGAWWSARSEFGKALPPFEAALKAEQAIPDNMLRQLQVLSSMVLCHGALGDVHRAEGLVAEAEAIAQGMEFPDAEHPIREMREIVKQARAAR